MVKKKKQNNVLIIVGIALLILFVKDLGILGTQSIVDTGSGIQSYATPEYRQDKLEEYSTLGYSCTYREDCKDGVGYIFCGSAVDEISSFCVDLAPGFDASRAAGTCYHEGWDFCFSESGVTTSSGDFRFFDLTYNLPYTYEDSGYYIGDYTVHASCSLAEGSGSINGKLYSAVSSEEEINIACNQRNYCTNPAPYTNFKVGVTSFRFTKDTNTGTCKPEGRYCLENTCGGDLVGEDSYGCPLYKTNICYANRRDNDPYQNYNCQWQVSTYNGKEYYSSINGCGLSTTAQCGSSRLYCHSYSCQNKEYMYYNGPSAGQNCGGSRYAECNLQLLCYYDLGTNFMTRSLDVKIPLDKIVECVVDQHCAYKSEKCNSNHECVPALARAALTSVSLNEIQPSETRTFTLYFDINNFDKNQSFSVDLGTFASSVSSSEGLTTSKAYSLVSD